MMSTVINPEDPDDTPISWNDLKRKQKVPSKASKFAKPAKAVAPGVGKKVKKSNDETEEIIKKPHSRGNATTWAQKQAMVEWLEIPVNFRLITGSATSTMKQVTVGTRYEFYHFYS